MAEAKSLSYIYILTNEAMPGLIKIGRTSSSVEQRLAELNRHAGIPLPFVCYYAARVTDSVLVERKLHEAFGDHRVRQQREFFRLSPHRAQAALALAAIEDATPKTEIVDEFPEDAEAAVTREAERRARRSFKDYQVPIGSRLTFSKDHSITATVNGPRSVDFRGQTMSMTAAALAVLAEMGYTWKAAQGSAYWEYEEEPLSERWGRLLDELSEEDE